MAGIGANTGFNALTEDYRPPESYQWNLTLSRELMKNTVLEVSYIGNHGIHLWRNGIAYNEVVPSARLAIAQALRAGTNADTLIQNGRRLRGVGPINLNSEFSGNASYNGLQVWLNRRFADRLSCQLLTPVLTTFDFVQLPAPTHERSLTTISIVVTRPYRADVCFHGPTLAISQELGMAANLILVTALNGSSSSCGVPIQCASGPILPVRCPPGYGFRQLVSGRSHTLPQFRAIRAFLNPRVFFTMREFWHMGR